MADVFCVEVCVATANGIEQTECTVVSNCTLKELLITSGLLQRYALDLDTVRVGIYGKLKSLDTYVQPGDRVEIYRPLLVDPNAARLRRQKKKQLANKRNSVLIRSSID